MISNGQRLVYGPTEVLKILSTEICPDKKDRGAYGSLFIGSCNNALTRKLNILVIDDLTGENGGIISPSIARTLVGDCHGKIEQNLAEELSGKSDYLIQHRTGFLVDKRVAKGTFQPDNRLHQLPGIIDKYAPNIDLVIPTSSFKGGDKTNNPIKPGLYIDDLTWIGEKSLSPENNSKTSIAEILEMSHEALSDHWKEFEFQLQYLDEIATDPRKLAEDYCQSIEEAVEKQQKKNPNASLNDNLDYQIIKCTLDNEQYFLLNHPKLAKPLDKYWGCKFLDTIRGGNIKWNRGMIMPSKHLKHGEICIPHYQQGEEVLHFRSPCLNTNSICLGINKHVPQMYAPNGELMKGTVIVSDEVYSEIIDRINLKIEQVAQEQNIPLKGKQPLVLHPDFKTLTHQERCLEVKRINSIINSFKEKGISLLEKFPYSTDIEAQGADFDGDCIAYERAERSPRLRKRVQWLKNHPELAYAATTKQDKLSFPNKWSFPAIAIFMGDEKVIGFINNFVKSVEALSSEIDILRSYGTNKQKETYLNKVINKSNQLLNVFQANKNPLKSVLEPFKLRIKDLVTLGNKKASPSRTESILALQQSIYKEMTESGCQENQVAVDMLKSARAPDRLLIQLLKKIPHRPVTYKTHLKKLQQTSSQKQPFDISGFSSLELMLNKGMQYFRSSVITKNPTHQFKNLFPQNYTSLQYNLTLAKKKHFDRLSNLAAVYQKRYQNSIGALLKITTKGGKTLELHNVAKSRHPYLKKSDKLQIRIVNNPKSKAYYKLIAEAEAVNEKGESSWLKLGDICENNRSQYQLKAGAGGIFKPISCELESPLGEEEVNLMFKEANKFALSWGNSIPELERKQYAAAAWHCCHTRNSLAQDNFKTSNFVFCAFKEEVVSQIKSYQLDSLKITGINKEERIFPTDLLDQTVDIEIAESSLNNDQNKKVAIIKHPLLEEQIVLGTLSEQDWQLPVGTQAQAVLKPGQNATANLQIQGEDQTIKMGYMNQGELAGQYFNGEQLDISFGSEASTQWSIKIDDQVIGTMDSNTITILENLNLNEPGTQLEVTLDSYGDSQGQYALAAIKHHDVVFRLHQGKAGHKFKDRLAKVTIDGGPPNTPSLVVYFHSGEQKYWAGKFTNIEEKRKAVSLFKQYGTNKLVASVNTVNTLAELKINPDTIVYPELGDWQDSSSTSPKEQSLDSKNADQILNKVISLPTLFYESPNEGSLGLTVDKKIFSPTVNWLFNKQITFTVIDETDPKIATETTMGYSVLRFDPLSISDDTKRQIVLSKGAPVIADFDNPSVSPYHDLLFDISADFNIRITPPPTLKSQSAPHLKNSQLSSEPHKKSQVLAGLFEQIQKISDSQDELNSEKEQFE